MAFHWQPELSPCRTDAGASRFMITTIPSSMYVPGQIYGFITSTAITCPCATSTIMEGIYFHVCMVLSSKRGVRWGNQFDSASCSWHLGRVLEWPGPQWIAYPFNEWGGNLWKMNLLFCKTFFVWECILWKIPTIIPGTSCDIEILRDVFQRGLEIFEAAIQLGSASVDWEGWPGQNCHMPW